MHIPQEYPEFKKPTLIVVTDNTHAKLFKAEEREWNPVTELVSDAKDYQEGDRMLLHKKSGAAMTMQTENIKKEKRDHLFHQLNEDLVHRKQNHEFTNLIIAAPEEEMNKLKDTLHTDLKGPNTTFIPKILTKEAPMTIIKHLSSSSQK